MAWSAYLQMDFRVLEHFYIFKCMNCVSAYAFVNAQGRICLSPPLLIQCQFFPPGLLLTVHKCGWIKIDNDDGDTKQQEKAFFRRHNAEIFARLSVFCFLLCGHYE